MDIGFFLTGINQSKDNQILKSIDEYVEEHPYDNVILFNDRFDKLYNHKFYTLHLSLAKYYDGILFVFNVKDAQLTCSFPSPKHQFLLIDSIPWKANPNIRYSNWVKIFNDSRFSTIVTSEYLYDLFGLCWKEPALKIEDFNKETIKNAITKIQ